MTTAPTPAERETFRRNIMNVSALPDPNALERAYAVKAEGGSDRTAAEAAMIPWWKVRIMLELGEEGHPVFEHLYITWRFNASKKIGAVEMVEAEEASKGPGKSRENFMLRERPEETELRRPDLVGRGQSGSSGQHSLPGGVTVQIAQFPPPAKKELPEVIDVKPSGVLAADSTAGEKTLD